MPHKRRRIVAITWPLIVVERYIAYSQSSSKTPEAYF